MNTKPNQRSRPVKPKGVTKRKPSQQYVAPAAVSRSVVSSRPQERVIPKGRSLVFKEYVQDIAGSVAFSASSFPVQPGLSNLFAWLATQAVSYQEYRFRRLRFIYETEKASSTSGKVMMAFLPDAGDPTPASKQEMLENEHKAANAVWAPCSFVVNGPEALGGRRYIRTGNLASNLDIKTYDLGNLIVATQGCADTSAVGELYVEYEIDLYTPVVSVSALALAQSSTINAAGSISDTALFGTAATQTGGLQVTASGDVLTFNSVGRYLVFVGVLAGTGLSTAFTPVLTAPTGGSASLVSGISNAAANAGTSAQALIFCSVVSRGTTLTIACDTQATTITAAFAVVARFQQS